MAVKPEQTMTCAGKRPRISARRSWVVTCSAEAMAGGERTLEGPVGGQTAVPPPGLRAHPFRARTTADARRHDILLRHRRNRVGSPAGEAAANGKDVALGGGANIAQQYLAAGLMDEMEIHVVPILLGGGERLLDNVNYRNVKPEPIRTIARGGCDASQILCPQMNMINKIQPRLKELKSGVFEKENL